MQNLVSADAVNRWFVPLHPESFDGKVLMVSAENTIYQYWIEENYMPQLTSVASRVFETPVKISFLAKKAPVVVQAPEIQTEVPLIPSPVVEQRVIRSTPVDARHGLNQRNTFDSFVVGINNQFAHAAAEQVAKAPARSYNPLFLHGRVGLGKTHLMQAIGHYIVQQKKYLRVLYVTSEQFTNEYIAALQHGELAKFRKSYRQVDVLLIDDIQFLAGKDSTQQEFFHTFNCLFDGSKQIVLTSDSPPNEIASIEKRLTSRFEWGLTAELQPPDLETRIAILRHKMSHMTEKLNEDVIRFIAEKVKSNVRRLEGAMTRVGAFASLHGKSISVQQAEVLLKDLLQQEGLQTVNIDSIQRKVAETYDIRLADMTSKRRPANIALPRQVAMYLSRKLTSSSLNEIGDAFGGRDHGTVLHACRTIEEKMKTDEKLRQVTNYLSEKLNSSSSLR